MNILVEWSEDFNLNIKVIDQQHKKFIDIINVLYDAIIRKESEEVLAQSIADMRDYAFVHFKDEEKYLDRVGYEGAEQQKTEHRFFLENVEKFYIDRQMYDPTLAIEVLSFLQDWFINHITQVDKLYVDSLVKNGIK